MAAGHNHVAEDNLKVAFALNLAFTIIEVIGGLLTNSIAILSDAVHDAGDCLSIGTSLWLEGKSKKGADQIYTYGHQRFSTLGALVTGSVLVVGLGFIISRAVPRLFKPEEVNAPGMIALAIIGIVFNGLAVLRTQGKRGLNESVVSWHLLEDVLGWIAVLIGSAAMAVWRAPILDPLLSIGISLFVLYNVGRNLRKALRIFLQATPDVFNISDFENKVLAIPGVRDVHRVHPWSLDGERNVFSTHVVLAAGSDRQAINNVKRGIATILKDGAFDDITVDVEFEGEPCIATSSRSEASGER